MLWNFTWNLEKLPPKLMIYSNKYMAINVEHMHMFVSGLVVFKIAEKMFKMLCLARHSTSKRIKMSQSQYFNSIGLTVKYSWEECVRQILHENFDMQNVFTKMVLKILTFELEIRKNICTDILKAIWNDSNLLEMIITCDESWFFIYDPETKKRKRQKC